MKKVFIICLAVIFGFALVMGCATTQTKDANEKEALTMGNGGNKKMKIKLKVKDGKLEKVTDESDADAQEVDAAEMLQIHQNQGFTYLGVILQAQINPTCAFVCVRGKCYKICQ